MRTTLLLVKTTILLSICATALAAAPEAPPEADYVEPTTGMEFMAIPGGTFTMGDNDDQWANPEHQVTVKPFLLGRFEVTFEQFAKYTEQFRRGNPDDLGWGGEDRPVINVNWYEAQAFVQWLSRKTKKNFRLPTEAEWEYAARGGTTTPYPWGEEIGENNANCRFCGSRWDAEMTAPVGSFAPNGYGLYDMIGNVYEWTLDRRHDNYQGAPVDGSAWIEGGRFNDRVNRGGSWYQRPVELTVFRRCWDAPTARSHEFGFRVLLEQ